MTRTLKLLGSMVIVALLSANVSFAQSSANSVLRQEISPLECSYTTVETGMGKTHDSSCPLFAPTIELITTNWRRPIITGIYDAVHTTVLRVQVNGVWYILGANNELEVNGNVWVLNLGRLQQALPAGKYSVIVEAEGSDGNLRRGEATMHLVEEDGDDEGGVVPERVPTFSFSSVLQSHLLTLFIVSLLTIWVLLFIIAKRRRNREDTWSEYHAIMHSDDV